MQTNASVRAFKKQKAGAEKSSAYSEEHGRVFLLERAVRLRDKSQR
jgi:hypothetical protein